MAQPSVANYFNTRKRAAVHDSKSNQARKVLILESSELKKKCSKRSLAENDKEIIFAQVSCDIRPTQNEKIKNLQEVAAHKIVALTNASNCGSKKIIKAVRTRKIKTVNNNNKDIQEMFSAIAKPQTEVRPAEDELKTPPSSPKMNAMDKVKPDGPSLKEIKNKMSRSSRLSELKASLARFQEADKKLTEIEKRTAQIPESPKLKGFKTIELEVFTSPKKVFSPEKAYLSPRKDESSGARKNLMNLLSPTKNAISMPAAVPSRNILSETSKPALPLPFKYRFLAEMFRAVDTVIQILYNRKETVTFRKLKPAVEEMMKKNLMEKHLAQIQTIYPDAFIYTQEKLRIFGGGLRAEQWELVIQPIIKDGNSMTSEVMLQRRRTLYNIFLNKVKDYHEEFLLTLDTPICIPRDKVTRWHPEFDIEKVPEIEMSPLPQPPNEDKLTTGQEVLERAKVLFSCNTRMELALQKLREKQSETPSQTQVSNLSSSTMPQSVLKGIPPALLEKVRQKQAAKALVSMTRSADKETEVQIYSRLPELARLTRNVFVSEKKGVLPLDTVVEKLGNSYRGNLTKGETEQHLQIIAKELPTWLQFHDLRNCVYVKVNKNADLSLILNKLEALCKQKNET